MSEKTTRCFECEHTAPVSERGNDCRRLLENGQRCGGRYVGLYEPVRPAADLTQEARKVAEQQVEGLRQAGTLGAPG